MMTRHPAWFVSPSREGVTRASASISAPFPTLAPALRNHIIDRIASNIYGLREWADATGGEWRRWWLLPEGADDVTYVQFMGKDNVAFHTVSFPVTLLGSGEPWKLV